MHLEDDDECLSLSSGPAVFRVITKCITEPGLPCIRPEIILCNISDLMIGVPVSFLIPTIGFNTVYKRINKRSGTPSMKSEDRAKKSDPLMSRLDFLFDVLDLREFDCQQRMVCEMVRDRDTFSPLSDLLLSIFR